LTEREHTGKKLLIVKLLVRQPPGLPDMLRRPCP